MKRKLTQFKELLSNQGIKNNDLIFEMEFNDLLEKSKLAKQGKLSYFLVNEIVDLFINNCIKKERLILETDELLEFEDMEKYFNDLDWFASIYTHIKNKKVA